MWNKATDTEESFQNKAIWWSAAAVAVVALGVGVYYRYYSQPSAPEKLQEAPPPAPAPRADADTGIQHPIPDAAGVDSTALPVLNESDQVAHDSLAGLLGAKSVEQFLVPENIVRHIVVIVLEMQKSQLHVHSPCVVLGWVNSKSWMSRQCDTQIKST